MNRDLIDRYSERGILALVLTILVAGPLSAGAVYTHELAVLAMFGGMSLLAFATNLIRSARWARTRQQQLDAIAERVVAVLRP